MDILHRDDLTLGGFAGLKEHQLVMDEKVSGRKGYKGAWDGLGNFVYLADAKFLPHGETRMHPHHEVDVISVMVKGRVSHEGSLEHGQELNGKGVQVQRAGGEGFRHNEINPDDVENRMIQLWVLPEVKGEPAGYKYYPMAQGEIRRIYGGTDESLNVFTAKTQIDVALLESGTTHEISGEVLGYVIEGELETSSGLLKEGDLFRGEDLSLKTLQDSHLILVSIL